METITLTVGEARIYRKKFEFKRIVEQLKQDLDNSADLNNNVESDQLEILTEESAVALGILFEVPKEVFFMTDWAMIEWWTSISDSYEYVQGAISMYIALMGDKMKDVMLLEALHAIDTDSLDQDYHYLQGNLTGYLERSRERTISPSKRNRIKDELALLYSKVK